MSCRIFINRFDYNLVVRGERKKAEHKNGLAVLDFALRETCGIDLSRQTIEKGLHGKPYFADRSDIHFNISHSGDLAAAAVCEYPVGVDIQVYRPVKDSLIKKLCSDTELQYIRSSDDKSRAFLQLWTLKESYIKATGDGMSFPMDEINFDIRRQNVKNAAVGRFSNQSGFYYVRDLGSFSLAACVLC